MNKPYYKCLFIKKNSYTKKKVKHSVISKCGPFTKCMGFQQTMCCLSPIYAKNSGKKMIKRCCWVLTLPPGQRKQKKTPQSSHKSLMSYITLS